MTDQKPDEHVSKRPNIVRGTTCGNPCPTILSGDVTGLKCGLETDRHGRHAGDHRTARTVERVGRIKYSWKNRDRVRTGPPVIQLEARTNPYLTGQMRKPPTCECPDWWLMRGPKEHIAPCRLLS